MKLHMFSNGRGFFDLGEKIPPSQIENFKEWWVREGKDSKDPLFFGGVEIEVQGTRQLRDSNVEGLFIFLVPPDIETLRQRLVDRGANDESEILARLAIAEEEMKAESLYDVSVKNLDLDDTIARVRKLIGL